MTFSSQQRVRLVDELLEFAVSINRPVSEVDRSVYPSYLAGDFPGTVAFTLTHPGMKEDRSDWSMLSDNVQPDGTSHPG